MTAAQDLLSGPKPAPERGSLPSAASVDCVFARLAPAKHEKALPLT
jgi:hypothetical protein